MLLRLYGDQSMKAKPEPKSKTKRVTSSDSTQPVARAEIEPVPSKRLLSGLVSNAAAKKTKKGRLNFIDALTEMGCKSVFDIIRVSSTVFIQRLSRLSDADGALAYKNAQCFAQQIGSLYREHLVSNGQYQHMTRATGVRGMVEVGPSYPNLFKENWDQFCAVGALSAVTGVVAYLASIYRLATNTLEKSGEGTEYKIFLDTRRPDLKHLLIDQHSTHTARPMLEIVNDVLSAGIKDYLIEANHPDKDKPIYELLAKRRHPFMFPYNFAHHQCRLGLGGKKPELGELNYRISLRLPINQRPESDHGSVQHMSVEAQRLLSGLSPQQQELLIERSLFTTFYLTKSVLSAGWQGPGAVYLLPHDRINGGYLVLAQSTVDNVNPSAEGLTTTNSPAHNIATIRFSRAGSSERLIRFTLQSSVPELASRWRLNIGHLGNAYTISPWVIGSSSFPADSDGYRSTINLNFATNTVPHFKSVLSFTLVLDEFYSLTSEQSAFFLNGYGVDHSDALVSLNTFQQQTELNANQIEALLSQRTHYPRLSPNCHTTNLQVAKGGIAGHYGSCYVNGHGSDRYDTVEPATAASIIKDKYDNAMGLKEETKGGKTAWYLTKTSLNRFDRLQRMIRLQRWMDIPFAKLDTLVISAMRSEGVNNLTLDFNTNTLRVLGVYRYLNNRYSIEPEEFAALLHHIAPYSTGERLPLLDEVFNKFALFDQPLVLDQQTFTIDNPNANSLRTLAQLCAGLGVSVESLLRMAAQTIKHVGPLKRDLSTVSSIYRQARVARMLGVPVDEGLDMVELLGGGDYQKLLCNGALTDSAFKPLKRVSLEALLIGNMRLVLNLVVDSSGNAPLISLLPGSNLQVFMGWDFVSMVETRLFSLVSSQILPGFEGFLKNVDGSVLTLEPLTGEQGIRLLTGKQITRDAWDVLFERPHMVSSLNVRCGLQESRKLSVITVDKNTYGSRHPDVLDLLMQLDWCTTWLKDSKQNLNDVRRLLGVSPDDFLPREGLTDRFTGLADATRGALVTDAQILALNLPTHELARKSKTSRTVGAPINWREVLLPLLDAQGLIKPLELELVENTLAQFQVHLRVAVNALELEQDVRGECVEKISNLLLGAHDRQLRLIEGLAQEVINLPMDRAQVVIYWAQTSVHALLSALLNPRTKGSAKVDDPDPLLTQLQRVLRYGQAALHLGLSTAALRVFQVRSNWLHGLSSEGVVLSLKTFYLLHSYSQWFRSQSQAEEALLGYFILANPAVAQLKTKAQRNAVNQEAATALASLLKCSKDEILMLFAQLPSLRACSMAEVDWIRRCQATSLASGLPARDLLRATALHVGSTGSDWQAVGEAVMAARH